MLLHRLLVNILFGYTVSVMSASIQSPGEPSDMPRFAYKLPGMEIARVGEFFELKCDAIDYEILTWKKWSKRENRYLEFPWYPGRPKESLTNNNQTLRIEKVLNDRDEGNYTCMAGKGKNVIKHTTFLKVYSCHQTHGTIYPSDKPPRYVTAALGKKIELICKGYFGCMDKGSGMDRIAQFEFQENRHIKTVRNGTRFKIYSIRSSDDGVVGSRLVINKIQHIDYKTDFICVLQTATVHSRITFKVNIKPPEIEQNYYWLICILVVIVLLIVCIIVYLCYGPRIKYRFKSKFCSFRPKTEGIEHDILILDSPKDEHFVKQHVLPQLEGYKIFSKDSVLPGHMENSEVLNAIPKSQYVILIYSEHFFKDSKAEYAFQTLKELNHKGIIIIQIEDISEEVKNERPIDDILKIAPSLMPTVKWPYKHPKSDRRIKNFYYSLKLLLLPKPKNKVVHVGREDESGKEQRNSTASTRPLLTTSVSQSSDHCTETLDNCISNDVSQDPGNNIAKTRRDDELQELVVAQISNDSGYEGLSSSYCLDNKPRIIV